jgi:hypothetical protein
MTLDDIIRQLAKKGQITHITLGPTYRDSKTRWQASYRDATSNGYKVEIADDPVDALATVLTDRRSKAIPRPREALDNSATVEARKRIEQRPVKRMREKL